MRIRLRWRLALGVAAITLVVVCSFALLISQLTSNFLSNDLTNRTQLAAQQLAKEIDLRQVKRDRGRVWVIYNGPALTDYASADGASVRLVDSRGVILVSTGRLLANQQKVTMGKPTQSVRDYKKWRVANLPLAVINADDNFFLQYGLPQASVEQSMGRINLFLIIGVIFATTMSGLLALLLSRRLLDPIRSLTVTSQRIARSRDLDIGFPDMKQDDEFGELSETLDEMVASLERSRDQLQYSLNRQRELVADASHELRTPLTSIITNLDILAEDLSGEDQQLALGAERSAKRMQSIIEDLLILARSDREAEQIQLVPVDLSEVVRAATGEIGELNEHQFSAQLPQSLMVLGDSARLQRLVINLLSNATKHCPAGSAILCRAEATNDGRALLTVADNGPGIPADQHQKVFERFYRIGGDGGAQGSGLGLAIVQTIVAEHSSQISLGPGIDGQGVAFHIYLPLAPNSQP